MSFDKLAGNGGTYFLESSTVHTAKDYVYLVINADAVFSTLTLTNNNGTTTNALTSQNLSGRTVAKGMTLSAPIGSVFSAITITSGSAIGVRSNP
jgi:hypothetical protein